jgi:hypothetical protein
MGFDPVDLSTTLLAWDQVDDERCDLADPQQRRRTSCETAAPGQASAAARIRARGPKVGSPTANTA